MQHIAAKPAFKGAFKGARGPNDPRGGTNIYYKRLSNNGDRKCLVN